MRQLISIVIAPKPVLPAQIVLLNYIPMYPSTCPMGKKTTFKVKIIIPPTPASLLVFTTSCKAAIATLWGIFYVTCIQMRLTLKFKLITDSLRRKNPSTVPTDSKMYSRLMRTLQFFFHPQLHPHHVPVGSLQLLPLFPLHRYIQVASYGSVASTYLVTSSVPGTEPDTHLVTITIY